VIKEQKEDIEGQIETWSVCDSKPKFVKDTDEGKSTRIHLIMYSLSFKHKRNHRSHIAGYITNGLYM